MRSLLILPTLLMAGTIVIAQQCEPPAHDDASLDAVLAGWEKALTSTRSFYAECQRTTWDRIFQTKEVFKGTVKYLKASEPETGSRASLELYRQTAKGPNPTVYEKYISTGTYLYEFSETQKVIRKFKLPQETAGQVANDSFFLSILFGMNVLQAKHRYQFTLTSSDEFYHYIQIQPKSDQDKADFITAQFVFTTTQFVLRKDTLLPARVWFLQSNKNEITWDILARADMKIPEADFEQPKLLPGWRFEPVEAEAKLKNHNNGP